MIILDLKRLISFLTISIIVVNSMFAQSIFSVIHLNDKEDIQHGYAKYITWKLTDFKVEGTRISKGSKSLNHNNQVIKDFEDDVNNDSWQNIITTDFNSRTGLVQSRSYYRQHISGDFILENQIFKYDINNFITEIINKDKNGKTYVHTLIKNNEKGLPIELISYATEETLIEYCERAEYLFDENLYISKIYSSEGVLLSSNKEILNFNDNYKFKNSGNEYNQTGDLIKSYISEDGYILHTYKYDEHSNWIEYHVYDVTFTKEGKEKKNLITIYKRHIEYW
jgi:flagellar hook protein FlgE